MIINLKEINEVYLANQSADLRMSIDGLVNRVYNEFKGSLLDRSLYVFINKNRNRVKIIYYENSGFWLLMKRLEKGKFIVIDTNEDGVSMIQERQLELLLEGLNMNSKYFNHDQKSGITH